MCIAMNGDALAPGERCASTSNRNFEGRQGPSGRTHLLSPAMAAAAALTGRLTDVRRFLGADAEARSDRGTSCEDFILSVASDQLSIDHNATSTAGRLATSFYTAPSSSRLPSTSAAARAALRALNAASDELERWKQYVAMDTAQGQKKLGEDAQDDVFQAVAKMRGWR